MSAGLWDIDAVAWWGAGLSTVLGATAVYDRFFRKPLPKTAFSLSTSHEKGNKISLINGGSVPIMVQHWEIFWGRTKGFDLWGDRPVVEQHYDDYAVLIIPPYSAHDWTFTGSDHFSWKLDGKQQLYITLRLVDRKKPVVMHIYNSSFDKISEPASLRRVLPHAWRPRPRIRPD